MPNPIVPGGVTDSNTTKTAEEIAAEPVSYTHLTLPTTPYV